jgi:YidC/Oxa1 family membrane protein insertase
MEKRTLLAIFLSILVLMVFSYLTPQRPVKKKFTPQPVEEQKEIERQKPSQYEDIVIQVPAQEISQEKEVKIETDLYSAVLTTRGGTIKQWELKNFIEKDKRITLVSPDAPIPPISIIPVTQSNRLPPKYNYFLSLDKDTIVLNNENKKETLTFFHIDPSGLTIKKSFTFYHNNYKVDVVTEVIGAESYYVVLGSRFGIYNEKGAWVHIGPVLLKDSEKIDIDRDNIEGISFIRRIAGAKSKDEVTHRGNISWIAQEDKYFTSALASLSGDKEVKIWRWGDEGTNKKKGNVEIAYRVDGQRGEFLLYAGPKKFEILKGLGVGLEHIIDFGAFSIIARPLFWILKFFYKIIGNYGWAIVLLTIVVRIPFIPLLNKSQKSMKKLQELQPKMAAIKERYKKDPQKMQREMMELYKKHKVNPLGGCLPILIQLPVFLALYKILLIAIELKGAPFILWITDLSAKDPYYILPITMGITMVIQQKMTPSSMDPKQAKIMMFMPVIFTFMFLSFPAGLVLYWLVNNVLGIIQQFYINKKSKKAAA